MPPTLIGRADEIARLRAAADRPELAGALVRGPAGVGKSVLLAAVRDVLRDDGRAVLEPAVGSAGPGSVDAVAALVEPVPGPAVGDRALASLRRRATAAGPPVVLLDDLDVVDRTSLAVLAGAAARGRCWLLAAVREPGPVAGTLASLRLDVLPLGGLDREVTATLAARLVGSRVGGVTLARLHAATGGNPLHVEETVREALRTGVLHPDPDGTYRARAELPLIVDLHDAVRARIEMLNPQQRRAAELLALGQPLRPHHLRRTMVDAGVVDTLEQQGILRLDAGGLHLRHPLHADALLERMTPGQRRRRLERLIEALDDDPRRDRRLRVRLTRWQDELGGDVPDGTRVGAARTALALGWTDLAARLVVTVASLQGEVLRAELDAARNEPARALARLGALEVADPDQRAGVELVRSQVLLLGLGDAAGAADALDAVADEPLGPQVRDEVRAARSLVLLLAGRTVASARLADEIDQHTAPATAIATWVSTSIANMLVGDQRHAALQARAGLVALGQLEGPGLLPYAEVQLGCTLSYVDANAGRIPQALERVRTEHERTVADGGAVAGLWASMRGHVELLAGNLRTARTVASDAVSVTRGEDPLGHGGLTLADQALATALLGDHDEAQRLLDELVHRPDASSPRVALGIGRVAAWTRALSGDRDGAVGLALDAASASADAGYHAWALHAAHDAVRLGAAPAARDHLDRSSQGLVDAVLLELLVEHGRVSAARDRGGLVRVGEALLAGGARLLGAEALAEAAAVADGDGDPRGATLLRRHVVAADVDAAWTLRGNGTPADLTARQREVARLVRAGRSNRQVADELQLSISTVENHLAAVYRKLGLDGRAGLDAQLDVPGASWDAIIG